MESEKQSSAEDPILKAASEYFGLSYLYPYQRLVIHNILEASSLPESSRARQIVILPTGAGKSLCFSLPGILLPGGTLIVYPLLGLMADQERRFASANLTSAVLRGGQSKEERSEIWKRWRDGEVRFLLANPEVLAVAAVVEELRTTPPVHAVLDEAHTVSQWGDTFRPAYLKVGAILHDLGIRLITAFTATASPMVLTRIRESVFLGGEVHSVIGNPDRENLHYRVVPTLLPDRELVELLGQPKAPGSAHRSGLEDTPAPTSRSLPRPALVFCSSRSEAALTARNLRYTLNEREIFFYHAGLSREEKNRIEEWFFNSSTGILCATCAYGMGIDKPNIRTVIHRTPPASVEAYLQEAGRGGRDREPAFAVLLAQPFDEKRRDPDTAGDGAPGAPLPDMRAPDLPCRRETLLSLLGAEPEGCSGCDVCDGTRQEYPMYYLPILRFLLRYPRRFSQRQLQFLLAGRGSCELRESGLTSHPGLGAVAPLSPGEVGKLLTATHSAGWIKVPRRGGEVSLTRLGRRELRFRSRRRNR